MITFIIVGSTAVFGVCLNICIPCVLHYLEEYESEPESSEQELQELPHNKQCKSRTITIHT